uniref:Protein kinase domain-containing protein n=1 Tax=Plectus sambesii TaxID=2011161 RepID=A0A914VVP5_9BILA
MDEPQLPSTSAVNQTLAQHYELCEIIEKGPFSTMHRAVHRASGRVFAVKTVDLRRHSTNAGLTREDVDKEVEVCASLKHPYLCELRDVIAGEHRVHMVFEFLDGMDICFEIVKRTTAGFVYSEAVASHYMKQLLLGLVYMHERGIVHRDIRPHSAVLANKDNSSPIKLTSFSVAIRLPDPLATVDAG